MKNIFKFFGAFLTVALSAALTGCMPEEQLETADLGLHIKVFSPTKVVAGQPMTINGSGFSDVTEIVFPDGVSVTDFEIVSNDMIRVKAPKGILAEGGNIIVRTEAGEEAVSPLPLTLGETKISGCSLEAGAEVEGGSQITIYGTDLEFVTGIEVKDEEGNPLLVEDKLFHKKSTSTIIFNVPRKVFEGEFEPVIYTVDEKTFKMPMLKFKPAADGGYWDIVEHVIWENADPEGNGSVSWSSQYRFHGEGLPDTNSECIATIAAADWDVIKNGTFYLKFKPDADAYQIRANTGWWSFDKDGAHDIHGGDERIIDNGDGTFSLAYTLSEEPLASGILGLIDEQHLLFTGSGYTPLMLYTQEEVWVEGGGTVEIVRTSIWKNDGSVGAASWSAHIYRFGMEGTDANNECIATIAPEVWEKMKTTPFKVQVQPATEGGAWQIRVLDGWWSVGNDASGALDFTASSEGMVDNGDGTFTFELDVNTHPSPDTPLVDIIDAQHLLFAGADFIILEMYWEEEVFVPGGGASETVVWENDGSFGVANWNNHFYRFCLEGKDANGECAGEIAAEHWEHMKASPFKVQIQQGEDWWQVRILDGHWSIGNSESNDISPNTPDKFVDNGDGTFTFEVDLQTYPDTDNPLVTTVDEKHLLFAGAGFIIQKIFYE